MPMTRKTLSAGRSNLLVKPMKPWPGERLLIPGDIHFDQHDPGALDVMLAVARDVGVTAACLVGDTFESAGISRHGRPSRRFRFRRGTIAAEREAARPYLEALREIVAEHRVDSTGRPRPGGLYVLTGNHERWWDAVQDEFPGLMDTPWFELYGNIFDGWRIFKEYTALKFGPLLVCHGHRLRGSLAKYSAASVLANYPGQNTLYGHTHRVDSCTLPTFKYGQAVRHGAWTIGHLKKPQIELRDQFVGPHAERHTQGFAIVDFYDVQGELRFRVDTIPIDRAPDGSPYATYGGKVYVG